MTKTLRFLHRYLAAGKVKEGEEFNSRYVMFRALLFLVPLPVCMTVARNTFKQIEHKPKRDFQFCLLSVDSAAAIRYYVIFSSKYRWLRDQWGAINGEKNQALLHSSQSSHDEDARTGLWSVRMH